MSTDSASERYRRRNRWPAAAIVGALALVMTVTWIVVLKPKAAVSNECNQPGPATTSVATRASGASAGAGSAAAASGPTAGSSAPETAAGTAATTGSAATAAATTPVVNSTLGAVTDINTLRDTRPANPATVLLQVVNASATPGMAKTVTETLRNAGFDSIRDANDDGLYPAQDLRCYGEIRYGPAGSRAARTMLIVVPCATLILDTRFDDSVDFAIGALYTDTGLTDDVRAELTKIKQAATPPAVIEGQTQAAQPDLPIPALPSTANCPA